MRLPKPRLSARAQRRLIDQKAVEVVEDGDDHVSAITDFVARTYLGPSPGPDPNTGEYELGAQAKYWRRLRRLEAQLHDKVGLELALASARLLRRRIREREERLAKRRAARVS